MLRIKEARNGKGLFTTTKLNKNDFVFKVVGQKVHFEKLLEIEGDSLNNSFRYSLNYYLMPSKKDLAYFINHSCEPNVWMRDAFTLEAMRDILPGEELNADYVLWETDEDKVSKWECQCGSENCRHLITGKDWQILNLQEKYRGHFLPLIEKRINGLN